MSRWGVVGAIIGKDLRLFLRDRFFVLITLFGLAAYVAIFWFLPDSVDETITIGVYQEGVAAVPALSTEGLTVVSYETTEELRAAVENGTDDVVAGLAFPEGILEKTAAGETVTITEFVRSGVPPEVETALGGFARELVASLAGEPPPFGLLAEDVIVLGTDRAGDQVSLQERMRPLLAVFVLAMEAMALAALVASEIEQRTVKAILITPASATSFLTAKSVFGTGLAFAEASLLLLLIGAFAGAAAVPLLVTVLLGAILVTGVAMMAGSLGKDFIGIIFWSLLFLIPLMVPGFAVLFPGSAATWVKILPSYGLARSIVDITTYGAGFSQVLPLLAGLAAWCAVLFAAGVLILRRKVRLL